MVLFFRENFSNVSLLMKISSPSTVSETFRVKHPRMGSLPEHRQQDAANARERPGGSFRVNKRHYHLSLNEKVIFLLLVKLLVVNPSIWVDEYRVEPI